jgi:hypothetical protein
MNPDNQTHALPLVLMAALVLLGVAALARLYFRKRQLQGIVESQFKGFREKAVALMDQLDALRKRHETLPSTDPDFTEPMSGATLALYTAVETDLNSLWERWLKVMELWDRAQRLIRSGSALAVRQAEEARKLLDVANVDGALRQSASCKERLDRLNRGHEQAREDLQACRQELTVLRKSVTKGSGLVLLADAQHERIASAEMMLTQAQGTLVADPIGSQEAIVRARRLLTRLDHPASPARDRHARVQPAYSLLDDLAAAADGFRAAAAKLRLTNLLGLFVRFWMVVWGFSLLIGLMNLLMPIIVFVLGFVFILGGFWAILQMATFWLWYGLWGGHRSQT